MTKSLAATIQPQNSHSMRPVSSASVAHFLNTSAIEKQVLAAMKVIDTPPTFLSNQEVNALLTEVKSSCNSENFQTIAVELLAYLRERPAGNVKCPQTAEGIQSFVAAIQAEGFKLEKAELLQIINTAPSSLAVLFSLIEEADIRFKDDELERMLKLSSEHLGFEPMPDENK